MDIIELNQLNNIELKTYYSNLKKIESITTDKTELFEIAQEKRIIKNIILERNFL